MILYIVIGTNDVARAIRFYDPVMATIGVMQHTASDSGAGYALPGAANASLWVETPFDGKPATVGNGSMPALIAPTRAAVDAFHAAALANGGTDEGKPGLRRYGPSFYACYVRDPDGNKLSAVCQD
jgi:catechol 2,3-dioxygenase-like lactoylglutathione lyase family enzyme